MSDFIMPNTKISNRLRHIFGLVICAISISCSAKDAVGLPQYLPKGFNNELESIGFSQCVWLQASIHSGQFDGKFIPSDEHSPNRVIIGDSHYDAVLSDDLSREYLLSTDGTGGVKYSDAFQNSSRKAIKGYIVSAELNCPRNASLSREWKFIFLESYGSRF